MRFFKKGETSWTVLANAILIGLTASGASALMVSRGLVAVGFNYSRDAVIGRRYRLHLGSSYKPRPRDPHRKHRRTRFNNNNSRRTYVVPPQAPPSLNIPTLELQQHHCRFPTASSPYCFCGAPAVVGSWCGWHYEYTHRHI